MGAARDVGESVCDLHDRGHKRGGDRIAAGSGKVRDSARAPRQISWADSIPETEKKVNS